MHQPYSTPINTAYNSTDREYLIKQHAPLAKIIAYKLAMRLPSHVNVDDLINAGIIGLIEAIDRFDPSKGVKLETFVSIRIRGAMLDELRAMDWMSRGIRQKSNQLEEVCANLLVKLGRTPTEDELCKNLGIEQEEFYELLNQINSVSFLSLEDLGLNGSGKNKDILECIADPDAKDPCEILNLHETKEILANTINNLPEKERLVLSLYYYEEMNLKEIGKVLNLTESRVCQLHSQAIIKLKTRLKKTGNRQ